MTRSLTMAELADEAGVTAEVVADLVRIGAFHPSSNDMFGAGDVIKVEAANAFLAAGLTIDDIANALDGGFFTFDFLDRFHPEPPPPTGNTLAAMAGTIGASVDEVMAVYLAMGLPEPDPDRLVRRDEEDLVCRLFEMWGSAGPDAVVRAARLVGEPARQLSEGWTRLFVEKISDPMAAEGLPMEERIPRIVDATERAARLAPEMVQWLLQRHLRGAIDRANIEGFWAALEATGGTVPPRRPPAVAFVDVSGYTALTERYGDEAAVRTSEVVRVRSQTIARRRGGSLVKLLGDGALLYFAETDDALVAVTDLVAALRAEGLTAHAGLSSGPVIEYDGDVFGSTVNLASRVAAVAGPAEVLVTAGVVETAGPEWSFEPIAPVALKGIGDGVVLHRVV